MLNLIDIIRSRQRNFAVNNDNLSLFLRQILMQFKKIIKIRRAILHAVYAEEAVIEKAWFAASRGRSLTELLQGLPGNPGIDTAGKPRLFPVKPLRYQSILNILPHLLETEALGERGEIGQLKLPGTLRSRIDFKIGGITTVLEKQNIRAGQKQHIHKEELVTADVSLVENFRKLLRPQKGDNLFKTVVKPAHELDISVFQHILVLAGLPEFIQSLKNRLRDNASLLGSHPGQPFGQTGVNEINVHLKGAAHHFIIVGQIAAVGIVQLAFNDNPSFGGRLVIAPDEIPHALTVPVQATEIPAPFPAFAKFQEIILRL